MKKLNQLVRVALFLFFRLRFGGAFKPRGRNYFALGTVHIHPGGSIAIGGGNWLENGFIISSVGGRIALGNNNYFNKNVKIVCYEAVEIGDDCLFGDAVHIYDQDHNFSDVNTLTRLQGYKTKPVKIGHNVWIGAKATILKGVTIGDGAVVGANAVISKDVPPNAIVVGNPGTIVKIRS